MTVFKQATAVAVFALAAATPAYAENVATPGNLDGWSAANVRSDGSVGITGTYKPAGETGSLLFTTNTTVPNSGQDKADFTHSLSGTLGDLAFNAGAKISYDYYVSSASTTAPYLAPALRLAFYDVATSKGGYLVYEPVYNGFPTTGSGVLHDAWVHADITNANFWMRTFSPGNTVEQFDVTLDAWANGATFPNSYKLSANTLIYGIEVGVGSGWNNAFTGAVDHVNVDFGRAGTSGVSTNFELSATAAVPEPATWGMMIVGFGAVGASLRYRRRKSAVAFG